MLKVKGIALYEKKLLVVKALPEKDGSYKCYTHDTSSFITAEEKQEIMSKPRTAEYLSVKVEDAHRGTLKEYYDEIISNANILKKETKGKINMFKTGAYSKTALKYLFDILNEKNITPENIEDYEVRFLMNAGGAFRLAIPYEGPMYKYDSNSYYASVYSHSKIIIPIKAGILKTISTEELREMKYFEVGMYHCKIKVPENRLDLKKLIWINPGNYYSHYELTYARDKGAKIEMIEENDNFLHYPRSHCKTGSELFGDFTKMLYQLKLEGKCSGAKKLLNQVWGMLVKTNKKVVIHNIHDPPLEGDAYNVMQIDDENFEVTYLREQCFEYNLARMKPFFLAKCRLTIAKTIEPVIDHVFYSHTDSIISDIKLDLDISNKLGSYKFEGYCENGFIKNGMSRTHNDLFIVT